MKNHKILGLILMALSVVFFGLFVWWGTTNYNPNFALGIIAVAMGTFLTGIFSFFADNRKD